MSIRFTGILHREDEEIVAICPELDIASSGDTVEQAMANLSEAIDLFIDTAKEVGSWATISAKLANIGPVLVTQMDKAVA